MTPQPTLAWQTVAEVLSRMQADLDTVWTRERCAEVSGYEADHFGAIFREVVGESPAHYHRRLRLERAAYEVADLGRTVGEAATRAGYDSLPGFSRAFRRQFGRPPTELQRAVEQEGPPVPEPLPADVLVRGRPEGLSEPPVVEEVGPLRGWTVFVSSMGALQVTAGMWKLVRPRPRVQPYTLGALAQPWGWATESSKKEFRCLRLLDEASPGAPILPWRQGRRWYARFDYRGPTSGIEAACFWMAAHWVPQSGLRLAYAPLFSLLEGAPDWRSRVRARLYVAVLPLVSPPVEEDDGAET